jgi:hypothetical protein
MQDVGRFQPDARLEQAIGLVATLVVREVADVLPDDQFKRVRRRRLRRLAVKALEATDQTLDSGDDGSR